MKVGLNVKLGIIAGIINCLAWYLIAKSLNYYSLDIDRYRYFVTFLLLLSGIGISIYYERKNNNGFIEYKDAAKCGILYTLILASFLAIFNYVYYTYLVPDAIDYFLSEAKKSMIEDKLTDDNIAKQLEFLKGYFGSFRMLMSTIIMGVIISLITAAFFRKKNPQIFSAN